MSERNEADVVQLVDAEVPADQGLSSLGLLMQLAGTVLGAYAGLTLLSIMFGLSAMPNAGWTVLAFATCIARSYMHRAAGTQLLYGAGALAEDGKVDRFGGVRRYIVFAGSQSLALGALAVGKLGVPPKLAIALTVALLAWPVTLYVLFQLPRFKRFKADLPLPEDKGFEGTAIVMTMFGVCGAVASVTLLLFLLDVPGRTFQSAGVLLVIGVGTLVVRSFLHVSAGISGLRETSVDKAVELANRYANFGVISSFCVGGAMLLFIMTLSPNVASLGLVCCIVVMLMAWPLIVRRFYSERQFADLLAGEAAPLHRRAPDAGLTSLGWLLFAHAVFSGVFVIMQLAAVDESNGLFGQMMSLAGGSGLRSIWFSVGTVVLQGWAGYELIRMSPHARVLATVFGVVSTAVTLYVSWPLLVMLESMQLFGASDLAALGPVAFSIVVPVLTVVIVNRKIAPTARARFRTKPAAANVSE